MSKPAYVTRPSWMNPGQFVTTKRGNELEIFRIGGYFSDPEIVSLKPVSPNGKELGQWPRHIRSASVRSQYRPYVIPEPEVKPRVVAKAKFLWIDEKKGRIVEEGTEGATRFKFCPPPRFKKSGEKQRPERKAIDEKRDDFLLHNKHKVVTCFLQHGLKGVASELNLVLEKPTHRGWIFRAFAFFIYDSIPVSELKDFEVFNRHFGVMNQTFTIPFGKFVQLPDDKLRHYLKLAYDRYESRLMELI